MRRCRTSLARAALCLAVLMGPAAPRAAAADPPEGLYDRLTWAYMDGSWDVLGQALAEAKRSSSSLTRDQREDVAYIARALAECRPGWWAACKAGRKTRIRQLLWGKPLDVTFDPEANQGFSMQFYSGRRFPKVNWDPSKIDSREKGEYGFLEGDRANISVWALLGSVQVHAAAPMDLLASKDEAVRLRLARLASFRGNVTSLYYAGPPGRRYALHIYFAAFLDKYGKGETSGCRRAVGAMLMAEVLADPSRYPSLKLPRSLPAEDAEKRLGRHYKFAIGRGDHWTIAEDRAYRAALAEFVEANTETLETEQVVLPNGLAYSLNDEKDAALRPKRDAWVKEHFDAAGAE